MMSFLPKTLLPLIATLAIATGTHAANSEQIAATTGSWPVIVDRDEPSDTPVTINGCELKPGTS